MALPKTSTILILSLSLGGFACNSNRSIQLPNQELMGIAFFVYSDAEHVASVSPLQDAKFLTFGNYELPEDLSDFSLDMYVFDSTSAKAAAKSACEDIQVTESRFVCLRALENCEPLDTCFSVGISSNDCEQRVELNSNALMLRRFREENKFLIEEKDNIQASVDPLFFCGPKTQGDCPFRIPGFVVTEKGYFQCIAPSQQLSCSLTIDLSPCGIDDASATISKEGSLSVRLDSSSLCTLAPIKDEDKTELGDANFVVKCGERQYGVTYADTLISTSQCPHLGPSSFDSDIDLGGELNALISIATPDGQEKLVLVGRGNNTCGVNGCLCANNGQSCVECCHDSCGGHLLTRCIYKTSQETCAEPPKMSCINECLSFCGNPMMCSSRSLRGLSAITMAPNRPYITEGIIDLEPPNIDPQNDSYGRLAKGNQPASVISTNQGYTVLALLEEKGLIFANIDNSGTIEKSGGRIDFDFDASAVHKRGKQLIVIGRTRSSTHAKGVIVRVLYDDPMNPASSYTVERTNYEQLPRIDLAAHTQNQFFIAASQKASETDTKGTIYALNELFIVTQTYTVEGKISGLTLLGENHLLVSVSNPTLDQDLIHTFNLRDPSQESKFRTLKGLRVTSLLAQADKTRVYVGYEKVVDQNINHTGAISVIEIDTNESIIMRAPFVSTKGGPVSSMALSLDGQTLYAIAANTNWISRFEIYE